MVLLIKVWWFQFSSQTLYPGIDSSRSENEISSRPAKHDEICTKFLAIRIDAMEFLSVQLALYDDILLHEGS